MISDHQTTVSKIDHSKSDDVPKYPRGEESTSRLKTDKTDDFMQKGDKKIQVKKTEFLDKLRSITYTGNVTMACQALGMSKAQVYKWRNDDPEFAQEWDWAIKESFETRVDETEQALRKSVLEGNITAIIFTLKSLKPKVYGDKVELKERVDNNPPLKAGFVNALKRLIANCEEAESTNFTSPLGTAKDR